MPSGSTSTPAAASFFADSACGSPAFDAGLPQASPPSCSLVTLWSRFLATDDLYSEPRIGYDLSDRAIHQGGGRRPELPRAGRGSRSTASGAVIYSKYDIGCALERKLGAGLQGLQLRERHPDRGEYRGLTPPCPDSLGFVWFKARSAVCPGPA